VFVLALALLIAPGVYCDQSASRADAVADEMAQVAAIPAAAPEHKARSAADDTIAPATMPAGAGQPQLDAALAQVLWARDARIPAFALNILPPVRGPPAA